MKYRLVVSASALVLCGSLAGCAPSPQAAGDTAADGLAGSVTSSLQQDVTTEDPDRLLPLAGQWLADPPLTFLRSQGGEVDLRVLEQTSERIDIVVWAYGRQPAFAGGERGWGHACRRYTRDAAGELAATELECPDTVPTKPG